MHEATLSGLSILIVEDEALLRKQIGAHLEKQERRTPSRTGVSFPHRGEPAGYRSTYSQASRRGLAARVADLPAGRLGIQHGQER